jgi:ribA/ribD-fused uncharacterized protein
MMIKEFKNEYRWLSNFFESNIIYKGRVFLNVENAFQSEKSDDIFWKDFCSQESDPRVIKKEGQKIKLRGDWEQVKQKVMFELIQIKFQDLELKEKLLETENIYIQEGNTWGDTYWGVDLETGVGENNLGKIIMQVRDILKTTD